MNTLTVKVPDSLQDALERASLRAQVSKSELVRRALDAYLRQRGAEPGVESALEKAGDLVGCFAGGPEDLSCNPGHLADFGRV